LLLATQGSIATRYEAQRGYRVEVSSTFSMETVDFSMERDGEPVEAGFGGDMRSEQTRELVIVDTILETKDGAPAHLRRSFETLSSTSVASMGDNEMEVASECPLEGLVLDLSGEDGEVVARVAEGSEPDDEKLLEGHTLGLALDALLPHEEVEEEDSWELDGEALLRALAFDVEHALFPPPAVDEEGGGEGDRRGRGRGRGRHRGGVQRYFAGAEWEAEARWIAGTEEHEGVECHVIAIEAEGSGELPEPEFGGGGRGRRGRAFEPGSAGRALKNSFEIEIEAKLYFSVEGRHPLHLELEADVATESLRERERGGSSMVISSAQEGTLELTVDVTAIEADGE